MIGRGTRIFAPDNKLMFRVYDYTNATRLFGQDFITKMRGQTASSTENDGERPEPDPVISVSGLDVFVNDAGSYILTTIDGVETPLSIEDYRQRLAEQLLKEAATLTEFRRLWIVPDDRRNLLQRLPDGEGSALVVQSVAQMQDYDLFDVLAELCYGMDAKTRTDRAAAFEYKHADWLSNLPDATAQTIRAIAAQFADDGIHSLESRTLFQTPAVKQAGGLSALKQAGTPADLIHETKQRIYAA